MWLRDSLSVSSAPASQFPICRSVLARDFVFRAFPATTLHHEFRQQNPSYQPGSPSPATTMTANLGSRDGRSPYRPQLPPPAFHVSLLPTPPRPLNPPLRPTRVSAARFQERPLSTPPASSSIGGNRGPCGRIRMASSSVTKSDCPLPISLPPRRSSHP